jgi:solute carrier family 25 folate transporter 32
MIRLQIQNDVTKTAMQTLQKILNEEGIRGLYRGVYATGAGYLPTWAIYFTVYDTSKTYYKNDGFFSDTASHCLSAIQAGLLCTVVTNPLWVIRSNIY